jgi:hypothetical protein
LRYLNERQQRFSLRKNLFLRNKAKLFGIVIRISKNAEVLETLFDTQEIV